GLATATSVVSTDPDREHAHRLRALALIRLKRYQAAVEAATAALRLLPNAWQPHVMYANAAMNIPTLRAGAVAAANRSVELAPNRPETHYTLGLAWSALGDK